MAPDADFHWLPKREVESLGVQVARELLVRPWPKPWQRREILRERLGAMDTPAGMSVKQRFTSKGPIMTKTQKCRVQRTETDARNSGVTPLWPRPDLGCERSMHRSPVAPTCNDNKAGGSAVPPRERTPVLELVAAKPMNETTRLKLEARLEALEAAVKRGQGVLEDFQKTEESAKRGLEKVARREKWAPRDDEESITPSSADVEAEEKRLKTDFAVVNKDTEKIEMVYVLLMSFKATTS